MITSTHSRAAFAVLAATFAASVTASAGIINLETPSLGAAMEQHDWSANGGGFTSGGAFFNNSYNPDFMSWGGFALSRATDNTTPGFMNQYSSWTGAGFGGSSQYAVGYMDVFTPTFPTITLPAGEVPLSLEITNTTYAALVIRDGDSSFGVDKFGGASGNDPDWYKLIITGLDAGNAPTGTVEFFLADYRFTDNQQDYIVNAWSNVNLSTLPWSTRALKFEVASSDVGAFGINTPTYFAVDQVTTTVPEPGSVALLALAGVGFLSRRRRA
jgi:hypothetical protein